VGQFFKALEKHGTQLNVASLVGHNTIRSQVLKQGAITPSAAQLRQMEALVEKGMEDGACGLSTGLVYVPGAFARTEEITQLASVVAKFRGLYVSHIRDEGPKGEEAIEEAISVGRHAGVPVHISHFKAQGPNQWGSSQERLDLIKVARESGVAVSLDQYPYTASSTGLAVLLPSWLSESGLHIARQKIADPAMHQRIRNEMLGQLRANGWKDYSFAKVAYCQFDQSFVGLSIAEIAERRRATTPAPEHASAHEKKSDVSQDSWPQNLDELVRQADTIMDVFSHGGAQMIFFDMSEEDVETIIRNPDVMFGSDSGVRGENGSTLPHPRGSGTFPRVIGVYARQRNLFSIEEAIRRMTSLPGTTFGLKDRGQVKEGYWADLVVFDRNRILDTATYQNPLSDPEGIHYVIINGSVVLEKDLTTASLPGMVLRRLTH
jgi:N-acyl-D-amino-acid deacylase